MGDDHQTDDNPSLWRSLRDLLNLRGHTTLRESIEEAIDDYRGLKEEPGDLDATERGMLRNMLYLSEGRAGDVAVPRADISAIDVATPFADVVDRFTAAGHSRLPVYRERLDEVVGMLHVKDVYAVLARRFRQCTAAEGPDDSPTDVAALMRKVIYVPPSMPLTRLLAEMRQLRTHMAIVVDEFGGTDGLVTIEDIVEEIFGEIEDEHDAHEKSLLVARPDGRYDADARLQLDELEETLGEGFGSLDPGDDVHTLGGLCVLLADHVPKSGESFLHPNGWKIEVLSSDGRSVRRLRLTPPAPGAALADEAGG